MELTLGVTGHLLLDAAARRRVGAAARSHLEALVRPSPPARLRLLSGLAPGADLVLTDAVWAVAEDFGIPLGLEAILVADAEHIIDQWLKRAAELGDLPSAEAQAQVRTAQARWLERADTIETLEPRENAGYTVFQQLGARLALEPDLLLASLRPAHGGKPGGTAEVVAWRREPDRIPAPLRSRYDAAANRSIAVIDPDTGQVAS